MVRNYDNRRYEKTKDKNSDKINIFLKGYFEG